MYNAVALFADIVLDPERQPSDDEVIRSIRIATNWKADVFIREQEPSIYEREGREDPWATWQALMETAKSYMVGRDKSMAYYLKHYRSSLTPWQKTAWAWAMQERNKNRALFVEFYQPRRHWRIHRRGEYVDIALPYHDAGGEKCYSSIDGKTKIQTDDD